MHCITNSKYVDRLNYLRFITHRGEGAQRKVRVCLGKYSQCQEQSRDCTVTSDGLESLPTGTRCLDFLVHRIISYLQPDLCFVFCSYFSHPSPHCCLTQCNEPCNPITNISENWVSSHMVTVVIKARCTYTCCHFYIKPTLLGIGRW